MRKARALPPWSIGTRQGTRSLDPFNFSQMQQGAQK